MQTALVALSESLAQLGIELIIINEASWAKGTEVLADFCKAEGISNVHCHFEPGYDERERDKAFKTSIGSDIKLQRYNDVNLIHPSHMLNKQGGFYKVFTAYKKALLPLLTNNLEAPLPTPRSLRKPIDIEPVELAVKASGRTHYSYLLQRSKRTLNSIHS